jgi:hypothetical protein
MSDIYSLLYSAITELFVAGVGSRGVVAARSGAANGESGRSNENPCRNPSTPRPAGRSASDRLRRFFLKAVPILAANEVVEQLIRRFGNSMSLA